MARAMWSGSLSFGLVNVPVQLFSATESKDVHFHQFDRRSGARVRNLRVVEGTHDEVPLADVVKGYELDDGSFVLLTPEELEAAEPERSRTIELEDFVDLHDIDPVSFEKTYYLGPTPDAGGEKAYALLLRAMRDAERVGVARFVMRGKEYLAAVRPHGDVLCLETMYFADEVRDPSDAVENLPDPTDVAARELEIAQQLIESLTTEWDPSRYRDTHRDAVLALIDRKAGGERIEAPVAAAPTATVTSLLDALEASVRARRRSDGDGAPHKAAEATPTTRSGGRPARARAASTTATAKKASAKKASATKAGAKKASATKASPRKAAGDDASPRKRRAS